MRRLELTRGERFGRLHYVRDYPSQSVKRQCVFKCDCGQVITAQLNNVRQGKSQSCGCLHNELLTEAKTTHGFSTSHPVLYNRWRQMHRRCTDPNTTGYNNYGGRGIRVAAVWHGDDGLRRFVEWALRNGFDPALDIDRENNNGHYSPNNCRWVTRAVNLSNRRITRKEAA